MEQSAPDRNPSGKRGRAAQTHTTSTPPHVKPLESKHNPIRSLFVRHGLGAFGRDFTSMLSSNLGKVLLQGGYFVLVARMLKVQEFGIFASIVALAAIVAPFASLGTMQLMVRNIAQGHGHIRQELSTSLIVTSVGSVLVSTAIIGMTPLVAPRAATHEVVALIVVADLICVRLVEACGAAFQSVRRMAGTAYSTVAFHGGRLVAATLGTLGAFRPTLRIWSLVYCGTSVLMSVAVVGTTCAVLGVGRPDIRRYREDVGHGMLFSVGLASQTIYNDVDKAMLGRLSTASSVGIYTAAYRIVDVSFAPMRSILGAAFPRMFEEGRGGIVATLRLARKLAVPGVSYCLFASAVMFTLAGVVPYILGPSFNEAVGALRGLAILPVIKAVQYLLADSLSGAGFQGRRTALQVTIAVLNVALNFLILPKYSWRGAVVTSIVSDSLLLLGLALIALNRRSAQLAAAAHHDVTPALPTA